MSESAVSYQKSHQTGCHNARRHTEDKVKMFLALPKRSGRQRHGYQPQRNNEEIHHKAAPDDETSLAEAPDFGNTVVDDVGNGENQQSGGNGKAAQLDDLGLEKIGCDEAYVEHNAHQHKRYRYFLLHTPVFYVVVLEYTAARARHLISKIGRKDSLFRANRQHADIKKRLPAIADNLPSKYLKGKNECQNL